MPTHWLRFLTGGGFTPTPVTADPIASSVCENGKPDSPEHPYPFAEMDAVPLIPFSPVRSPSSTSHPGGSSSSNQPGASASPGEKNPFKSRSPFLPPLFGHVALPQLQQLFKEERVKGLRIKGEPKEVGSCETSLTSKFSRFPFHSTVGQSSDPVELVHVDLVGPMKVKGDGGALYSMTMVDDYTRLTWSFPLAKKSDAARVIIEEWLPMVERESGKRVKAIRSDCGGEFLRAEFRSWFKRHGIKQQITTAYTPQSNCVAERANRTIIEARRTILVDSGLPLQFWPLAIRHATVIKNRVLTHVGGQH
ncbi:unnamed protein product [Closterium sp. NIES-53]